MLAALFPGQGSQSVGMGRAFFESSSEAREIFKIADSVLGVKLSELCFEGPIEELTLTRFAQPALLTVSTIAFRLSGLKPDAVAVAAGHSLGEYSALVAAGALEFADAVRLVHERGRFMQEAVAPGAGKMVAVMGAPVEEIEGIIREIPSEIIEIANLNSPGQTVVAGSSAGVELFSRLLGERGGKTIQLNVSAPFHCSLMKPAADALAIELDKTNFSNPQFPVIANFDAQPVVTGEQARDRLKAQVCGAVRWTESMELAVNRFKPSAVVEFGPGGVLSKLMKRTHKELTRYEVSDPTSLSEFAQTLG